ncbi:MAG TPA: hypothetical protein VFV54_09570, partial [Thermoanaerobaculia bacterium]|nr:hypothetical protein [Thermoanaerobaculia bacterium]
MTERADDIARRIEQTIREAVDRMVADMRSSIEDVRTAVVQQLDAAAQSVQADAKSLGVRSQLGTILEEIEGALAPPPPPPPAMDSGKLRSAVRAIEGGKSQVEILNGLLDQGAVFASRLAVFILKGDTFQGWKGVGFAAHGGVDENVKRFAATTADVPDAARMMRDERVVPTDGNAICNKLGAPSPSRAILIPMVIKDKIAAALYADAVGDDEPFDRAGLELLVFTTGLLIDTLAIRKKIPSPSLSGEQTEGDATIFATPDITPGRPAAHPAPPPAADSRPIMMPRVPPSPKPDGPRPVPTFELEPEPVAPRFASQPGLRPTPAPQPPPVAPTPPPAPPRQAAPPPPPPRPAPVAPTPPPPPAAPHAAPAAPAQEGDRPSTQYVPPPGVVGGGRFGGQQPQTPDMKKHDE